MSNFRWLYVAVVWCGLVCSVHANDPLEEVVERSYPFDPDGVLTVRNLDGVIRVYGGATSELKLRAIKRAYTEERLKTIDIQVHANRKAIEIETKIPKKGILDLSDRSGTTEYILVIPFTSKIKSLEVLSGEIWIEGFWGGSAAAHLENGWLFVHNCFESLDLKIGNGRLDVVFDWPDAGNFAVNATGNAGNLRAVVPPVGPFHLRARTAAGRIFNGFESAPDRLAHEISISRGATKGMEINLKTENGNIQIDKSY
jgi:hypothetical protein